MVSLEFEFLFNYIELIIIHICSSSWNGVLCYSFKVAPTNPILLLLFGCPLGAFKPWATIYYFYYWPVFWTSPIYLLILFFFHRSIFFCRSSLQSISDIIVNILQGNHQRQISLDSIYREVPFIFHESFRFPIWKWMMPPN